MRSCLPRAQGTREVGGGRQGWQQLRLDNDSDSESEDSNLLRAPEKNDDIHVVGDDSDSEGSGNGDDDEVVVVVVVTAGGDAADDDDDHDVAHEEEEEEEEQQEEAEEEAEDDDDDDCHHKLDGRQTQSLEASMPVFCSDMAQPGTRQLPVKSNM